VLLTDSDFQLIALHIGRRLKAERKIKEISILELSLLSGVSDNHISLIENGKRIKVSLNIYLKLAAALEIDPLVLFEDLNKFQPFKDQPRKKY
jgi:transcriptional regulator with XRE-family HTH domain